MEKRPNTLTYDVRILIPGKPSVKRIFAGCFRNPKKRRGKDDLENENGRRLSGGGARFLQCATGARDALPGADRLDG